MREFATPSNPTFVPSANLTEDVVRNASEAPTTALFSRPGADGWSDVTAAEFHAEVAAAAKGLIAAGVMLAYQIAVLDIDDGEQCLALFKSNSRVGLIVFAGLFLSFLMSAT